MIIRSVIFKSHEVGTLSLQIQNIKLHYEESSPFNPLPHHCPLPLRKHPRRSPHSLNPPANLLWLLAGQVLRRLVWTLPPDGRYLRRDGQGALTSERSGEGGGD